MSTPDGDGPDTRSRLRDAALDLFGRQGVGDTSTREIIKAAGLRNPSAITYYFGSKSDLVDDLVREVNSTQSALLQRHVALASQPEPLTPEAWATIGVDFVLDLMSTERGCHLVRVWADWDDMDPDRVERFLAGRHPLAEAWRTSVFRTFPELSPLVAIARNVIVIRTLQWITERRARLLVDASETWRSGVGDLRPFMLELSLNILTGPTHLTDEDLVPS
ncbi:MAG TPA: TetR/AcrR family transcriptional regulator [Acidimicrobiia bacterium]